MVKPIHTFIFISILAFAYATNSTNSTCNSTQYYNSTLHSCQSKFPFLLLHSIQIVTRVANLAMDLSKHNAHLVKQECFMQKLKLETCASQTVTQLAFSMIPPIICVLDATLHVRPALAFQTKIATSVLMTLSKSIIILVIHSVLQKIHIFFQIRQSVKVI